MIFNFHQFVALLCYDVDLLLVRWCCTAVVVVVGDDDTDADAQSGDAATSEMEGDDGKDAEKGGSATSEMVGDNSKDSETGEAATLQMVGDDDPDAAAATLFFFFDFIKFLLQCHTHLLRSTDIPGQ